MLPDTIKSLRDSLDLSRRAFGEKLHVSGDVVNSWERGRVPVPDSAVQLICLTFSVNEHWLRTGAGDMFLDVDDVDSIDAMCDEHGMGVWMKKFLHDYAALDEKTKAVIDAFVESAAFDIVDACNQREQDALLAEVQAAAAQAAQDTPPADEKEA